MIVTRHGNCLTCKKRLRIKRTFHVTVDIFADPKAPTQIRGDLSKQIKAFRDEPLYCEDHQLINSEREKVI